MTYRQEVLITFLGLGIIAAIKDSEPLMCMSLLLSMWYLFLSIFPVYDIYDKTLDTEKPQDKRERINKAFEEK